MYVYICFNMWTCKERCMIRLLMLIRSQSELHWMWMYTLFSTVHPKKIMFYMYLYPILQSILLSRRIHNNVRLFQSMHDLSMLLKLYGISGNTFFLSV
jgi:hypothetical protein